MNQRPKVSNELFAGYIPVIHDGYVRALDRHPAATVGVFNNEILSDFDYLRKDIRALTPEAAEQAISGLGRTTIIMGRAALNEVLRSSSVVMPDDDIARSIKQQYPDADIALEPIFLRWDRDNTHETSAVIPNRVVTMESDDPIIQTINREKRLSTNWWRRLGSLVVDANGDVIISGHNSPIPSEYSSTMESDPRITARRGKSIDCSIDLHAEMDVITDACRQGIKLEGLEMYVSTFPCPTCAKLIGRSGIKSVYFMEGYAMLDGQRILQDYGVEIVKVETGLEPEDQRVLKPYPTKS